MQIFKVIVIICFIVRRSSTLESRNEENNKKFPQKRFVVKFLENTVFAVKIFELFIVIRKKIKIIIKISLDHFQWFQLQISVFELDP